VTLYTITITPDDQNVTTSLRLDTTSGEVRLTDLNVHADGGMALAELPTIDFALLLRAIGPVAGGTGAGPASPRSRRRVKATTSTRRSALRESPAADQGPSTTKRAGKPAGKVAEKRVGKRVGKRTSRKAASVEESQGARAYRRMPEDFAAVYRDAGSAAAVAEHYGVPKHTAYSWIRRL
jgi:hypothetical protein